MIQECKIPSAKPIFMDFAVITVKELNSHDLKKNLYSCPISAKMKIVCIGGDPPIFRKAEK